MAFNRFPSAEHRLIESLKPFLNFRTSSRYPVPIGDDAAVRKCRADEKLVLTADSFVENVHFSFSSMTSAEVGYKAMAVNLSDCAAMGALPDGALVQIIFPEKIGAEKFTGAIRGIYKGLNEACRKWRFPIVGGNLSKGPCWIIDISLVGRAGAGKGLLKRKGAKNNDGLWVTGLPGQSGAGRACLENWGGHSATPVAYRCLVRKHVRPVPRIEIGLVLAGISGVHAAIDVSDGVSKECRTLSYDNKLGVILTVADTDECVSPAVKMLSAHLHKDWRDWFYGGGEDYELLFAASPAFDPSTLAARYGIPITRIGWFKKSVDGVVMPDSAGSVTPFNAAGWDHLRNALPL